MLTKDKLYKDTKDKILKVQKIKKSGDLVLLAFIFTSGYVVKKMIL